MSKEETQDISVTAKDVQATWLDILAQLEKAIVGKTEVCEDLMLSLLAGGHVLLEGVPGIAKTWITNQFAATLGCEFKRAQFTPDLLPSDVLGTNIYDQKSGTFKMRRGPIFTNILLADEINRSPPKTQAALLEAMAEKQVSIEGTTYKLDRPFMVIATQNPVEQEGTYPLPEAQVDRFAMKLNLELPSDDEELEIIKLKHFGQGASVDRVTTPNTLNRFIKFIQANIYVDEDVLDYIRNIVTKTRSDGRLILGGSPRCSIALLETAKSYAAINGRDYVIPDDIKRVIPRVVPHRLQVKAEAELEGTSGRIIADDIQRTLRVPI